MARRVATDYEFDVEVGNNRDDRRLGAESVYIKGCPEGHKTVLTRKQAVELITALADIASMPTDPTAA